MAVGGIFRYAQRALFAAPTADRQLLRLVKGRPIRRIVQLGLEDLTLTRRLLEGLVKHASGEAIHCTLIDAFEQRPSAAEPLALAQTYRELTPTGVRLRLVPGDPSAGLAREANALADTDLLVLAPWLDEAALRGAWFYVPRMCHPATLVLQRQASGSDERAPAWREISTEEVAQRAGSTRRAAA